MNKEESWAVQSSSSSYSAFIGALRQTQFMASANDLLPMLALIEPPGDRREARVRAIGEIEQ
jgi:hypothetical protein